MIGLANRIGVRLGARAAASLPGIDAARRRRSPATRCGSTIPRLVRDAGTEPPLRRRRSAARSGARSINRADARPATTAGAIARDVAVHHVCGPRNVDECAATLAAQRAAGDALAYELVGTSRTCTELLARATLAVCRAGAGTVAELTAAGVPAVLVPLPGLAERPPGPQRADARAEPARRWSCATRSATRRGSTRSSRELLARARAARARWAAAARALARPDAAARLADLVEEHAACRLTNRSRVRTPRRSTSTSAAHGPHRRRRRRRG